MYQDPDWRKGGGGDIKCGICCQNRGIPWDAPIIEIYFEKYTLYSESDFLSSQCL
jgi:hypothetical protein